MSFCEIPYSKEERIEREREENKAPTTTTTSHIKTKYLFGMQQTSNKYPRNQRAEFVLNDIICSYNTYKIMFAKPFTCAQGANQPTELFGK